MPGKAAGRGRGRGRGRRRASTESSEEMDWEETSSESTEEEEEDASYGDPLGNAEDEVDEVCCPLCGEVFKHDDDMPSDTRLPLKYLVTSHILAAHPEDEDIIEPPSENNSSAFRDSASPSFTKGRGTDTQASLVPDSGESLEVPDEAEGSENPESTLVQPTVPGIAQPEQEEEKRESLEEAKQKAREKRDAAKELKEQAEQAEARAKVITEKKIFVPTTLDDEDSEKTIDEEPMPAPSLLAPAAPEPAVPEAMLSYSQTVSQLMPEHYPIDEPAQEQGDITVTVKDHNDTQAFTVSVDTKIADFVQQISDSKGVTCKATLVCGRELQGNKTLSEEGISDGATVRYVVLAKPPKPESKPAAKAEPVPKPKVEKPKQKESGEAPKRKRDSEGESDAKKQKADEHPAEAQAKSNKIRGEVVKRLCARIVSEGEAPVSAVQPIAADLEEAVWELHGAVRCGPYRSHIRRLFAMNKDMAKALVGGLLTPEGASRKTE